MGENKMVALYKMPVKQHRSTDEFSDAAAHLERLLARFDPISLAEMDNVALLNRTDTKYILRTSQLYQALGRITGQYRVLEVNHTRLNHYRTLYFDTSDFALYQQHHNGLRSRYKVRMREYVDSDLAYWEVKCKTNQERTVKSRLQTRELMPRIMGCVDAFIDENAPVDAHELEPKLWSEFQRITLVSKHSPERLTLDVNLAFSWNEASITLPGIAIAEVKQERSSQPSDFIRQMRWLGVRPNHFSKYCAGVYLLYTNIKANNFKAQIRMVDRLIQEENTHERVH
jgi:hypothetical protein